MSDFIWYGPIDVHDDQWWQCSDEDRRMMAGLLETLGLHTHLTWRLEFDDMDGPTVTAYSYVRDEQTGNIRMGRFGDIESRSQSLRLHRSALPQWWQP